MGILDRFRSRTATEQNDLEARSIAWLNPSTVTFNVPGNGAVPAVVGAEPLLATGVPAVYSAVSMIAGAVGAMPWEAEFRSNLERVEPQPSIIRRPDPDYPVAETKEAILSSMLLYGEAFVALFAHDRSGRPTIGIPLANDAVTITWNENRTRPRYFVGEAELRLYRDILHIRALTVPGLLHGLGPIQAARVSVAGSLEAEAMATEQFTEGGPPIDGVITVPGKLTKPEADLHREQWSMGRGSNNRGPAFLSGGMGFTASRLSNSDLQFLQSRNYGVLDVARLYRIPPSFLAAEIQGSSLTYSNQEQAYVNLIRQAYQPWADKIETAFGELIPSTQVVVTSFAPLLRADIRTRYDVYEIASRIGVLTPNEIREAESLGDPIPGGDQVVEDVIAEAE